MEEGPPPPTPEWAKPLLSGKIPSEWIDCDVWDGAIDGDVEDPVIHLADTNFYSDPQMMNTGDENPSPNANANANFNAGPRLRVPPADSVLLLSSAGRQEPGLHEAAPRAGEAGDGRWDAVPEPLPA